MNGLAKDDIIRETLPAKLLLNMLKNLIWLFVIE